MASTSQSAREYIQNARTRLVNGGLQNLSIIVENLHQKRVFTEEEVSDIQTETTDFNKTRTILDRVTNKGEKACYELLKIIDATRRRTLHIDQHLWITWFPFGDDVEMDINYSKGSTPCHKYQAKLKKKAIKLSEDVWKQSKQFLQKDKHLDLSFSPLVLDTQGNETAPYKIIKIKNKKCKKTRPKKIKTYIPEDKQKLSVDDILKTHENTILLVGKTGIGKTTVAHQMLKIWGGSDNKDLDYMFYFDKREMSCITNPMSLEDLLFNTFSEPDEAKEDVLEDIKRNSENVTIIFDGLTDLSSVSVIKRLVDGDLLPEAKIVITCRPEVESEEFLSDWASFRVEVKGFSTNSINAYLAKMLSTEQLSSILNNVELFSLCHVPVYALMVVACFSFTNSMAPQERCTVTEIYINTIRGCIQQHSGETKDNLNKYIRDNSESIFALSWAALQATQEKSVNLRLSCEESCIYSAFINTLYVKVDPTEWKAHSAFLNYTLQEFFAGFWFLKNPDKITDLLQQCCSEEMKHMKHVIPFLCGLSSEKNHTQLECLVPDQQLKDISNTFIREVISTFLPNQDQDDTDDSNIMFLCQCLYESQSTEACLHFLEKLDYCLDLSKDNLDPHHYGAVSFVISQSQQRKLKLTFKDTLSEQGLRSILGFLENVQLDGCDTLKSQLWEALLLSEEEMDYRGLLGHGGNELYLPVCCGKRHVFERAVEVMQNSPMRVHLCLLWDRKTTACQDLRWTLLESLPHIDKLSFRDASRVADSPVQEQFPGLLVGEEKHLLLDLCREAAIKKRKVFQSSVNTLLSLFSVYTTTRYDILLDLYLHISSTGYKQVLPILKPLYPPAPTVWSIDLSERKASVFLECLKLQPEKKLVELRGWSDEESEVKTFLQCLPYISKLSFGFTHQRSTLKFLGKLICEAAEREEETGEKIREQLSSVCIYKTFPFIDWHDNWENRKYQSDLLLDLYSYVKNYESQTGRSVLPALKPVYQSAPTVWSIDLSERKTSLLLELLKLQPEKKPVELTGWSDEESERRIFLQCLPYISQLSVKGPWLKQSGQTKFLGQLFCEAARREEETGEKILEQLSSVCNYKTFPFFDEDGDWEDRKYHCDLLLDLDSQVKNYETQTGRSVLPALQPVYQSAPKVWSIDLSERKASLLLELLKLQPKKKPVELTGWSDEESEVRIFLQCLPYISKLRFMFLLSLIHLNPT